MKMIQPKLVINQHKDKKIYTTCRICGKPIHIRRKKTCSDDCKKIYRIKCNPLRISLEKAIQLTNKTSYILKESSYISSSRKAIFIDKKHGEFEQIPQMVWYRNAGHPNTVKERKEKTSISKYGTKYPMGNENIKNKVKDTCMNKYGKENPLQVKYIKEKRKKTCITRYRVDNPMKLNNIKYKVLKKRDTVLESSNHKIYGKNQKELRLFIEKITNKKFTSTRKIFKDGKELDMYNSELKIAIEYCGLYWHTEDSPTPRDKNYHYTKYKLCKEKGIRLITIFEDEWMLRKQQVKGFLKSVFNVNNNKVYARNTKFIEMNTKELKKAARDFVNQYHIQKVNQTSYAFGITYKEELVAVVLFGKHPSGNLFKNEICLNRLVFKENYVIVGGFSKLLLNSLHFFNQLGINTIRTWSDNRWTEGNVYKVSGFSLEKEEKPTYSYVNFNNSKYRILKNNFRKTKLKIGKETTETEWTLSNNFHKIWDCGKKRWMFLKK